jgi:aldehyde:ferredoxin oxidoreductase
MNHSKGPLLSINVRTNEIKKEEIDDILSSFIGGRGVGTKLAHERIPFNADPLGSRNRIYFSIGPLQYSPASFTGRTNATALSPLTNGLLSSNAGGFVSRNFADTGYSAIELTGTSSELIAVHIRDDGVLFEKVPDLVGATSSEVTTWAEENHELSSEHICCIGPAGENQVRYASIMTTESRAFGRGGLGAVLGGKNIKVISFQGNSAPEFEFPSAAAELNRDAATSDSIMKRQGTTSATDLGNEMNALPTRFFSEQSFEGVERINGDRVEEKKYKKGTCSECAFACKLPTKDEESEIETEGPEYETVMSFGSNCDVDDITEVMKSNDLCDEFGLDTISAGATVAAYLASRDEFGNTELIHTLLRKIANREGVGDLLAEGVDRVHGELNVENWSVKGMEFSAHDGRALHGQALGFATANRGADHMYATFYAYEYPLVSRDKGLPPKGLTEEKVERLIRAENKRALEDCGIFCRFSRSEMAKKRFESLLEDDFENLLQVGARVVELERHFNNIRGMDRTDDQLPYHIEGLETALNLYYEMRGWRQDGTVPPRSEPGNNVSADD